MTTESAQQKPPAPAPTPHTTASQPEKPTCTGDCDNCKAKFSLDY